MKKLFFIGFVAILLSTTVYLKFDDYLKNYLVSELSQKIKKRISIDKFKTNLLDGSLTAENIKISDIQDKTFKQNLIEIQSIYLSFDISSIFSETVVIKNSTINGTRLNYKVSIVNGKIVDNFNLIDILLKKPKKEIKENTKVSKNTSANKVKKIDNKPQLKKNLNDKNFVIEQLNIPSILIDAKARDIDFSKQIKIKKMTFQNVGNTKNSNHFKDVFAMIGANIVLKLNNEIIINGLKKKFEDKFQKLLKNNKFKYKLQSIIGSKDSEKIMKKLEKFFK